MAIILSYIRWLKKSDSIKSGYIAHPIFCFLWQDENCSMYIMPFTNLVYPSFSIIDGLQLKDLRV